jgi:hypothetical protein
MLGSILGMILYLEPDLDSEKDEFIIDICHYVVVYFILLHLNTLVHRYLLFVIQLFQNTAGEVLLTLPR